MTQNNINKDVSITRACRVDKVANGTHTLSGFAPNGSKLRKGIKTTLLLTDVLKDMTSLDAFTVLIEGFAAPGEDSPDALSSARAQAFFDDFPTFKGGAETAFAIGRGVVSQATTGHPEKDRKVVATVFRP